MKTKKLILTFSILFILGSTANKFFIFASGINNDDLISQLDTVINDGMIHDNAKDSYTQNINRGQLAKMLTYLMLSELKEVNAFDMITEEEKHELYSKINYMDLNINSGNDYVALAHFLGFMSANTSKRFGTDDLITREEAAKAVFLYYNFLPEIRRITKSHGLKITDLKNFSKDVPKILAEFDFHFYNDLIYGLDDENLAGTDAHLKRVEALLLMKRFYIYTSSDVRVSDIKAQSKSALNRISDDFENMIIMEKFKDNLFVLDKATSSNKEYIIDKKVKELFLMINEERAKAGRNKLKYCYDLNSYSKVRANELIKQFSHTRPDGTEFYSGTPYKSGVSENIAAGYSSAQTLFKSWMESPDYKNEILVPEYDKICIGFAKDAKNNQKYYWSQLLFDEYYNNGFLNTSEITDKETYIKKNKAEILKLVNIERNKVGLNSLVEFTEIGDYSDLRATELIQNFSHIRPDGTNFASGMQYKFGVGENIAGGQISAQQVMNEWMHSDGHRENILRPEYDKLGVGFIIAPNTQYTYYWVQTFYAEE